MKAAKDIHHRECDSTTGHVDKQVHGPDAQKAPNTKQRSLIGIMAKNRLKPNIKKKTTIRQLTVTEYWIMGAMRWSDGQYIFNANLSAIIGEITNDDEELKWYDSPRFLTLANT